MKFGGIDVGSNAMRLLIGEVVEVDNKVHISKLSLVRLPVRLGSDVFDNGMISPQKEIDFIRGMEAFRLIMGIHQVSDYRACATSAMRNALNGADIAEKTFQKTGIDLEIIDGDKEGEIILSTFHLLSLDQNKPYLYIDVGGGSTEISLLIDGKAEMTHSFNVGTVRMLSNKIPEGEWENMLSWADDVSSKYKPEFAIGTGGNINKIIKLCCQNNEMIMDVNLMRQLSETMSTMTIQERMLRWDLRSDRADVIVPAAQIYLNVLEHVGISSIIVPKLGLADGLLYSMFKKAMEVDN